MPDVAELGRRVQQKYPGAYDDLDPAEVGRRVQAKHPGAYDDFEDTPAQAPLPPYAPQPSRATLSTSGLPSPEQVDASATGAAQAVLQGVREMSQQIAGSLAPSPEQIGQQLHERAVGSMPRLTSRRIPTTENPRGIGDAKPSVLLGKNFVTENILDPLAEPDPSDLINPVGAVVSGPAKALGKMLQRSGKTKSVLRAAEKPVLESLTPHSSGVRLEFAGEVSKDKVADLLRGVAPGIDVTAQRSSIRPGRSIFRVDFFDDAGRVKGVAESEVAARGSSEYFSQARDLAKPTAKRSGEAGVLRLGKHDPIRTGPKKEGPGLLSEAAKHVKPAGTVIGEQKGGGKELKTLIDRAFDEGEVKAGKRLSQLDDAKLAKLTRSQRFELLDSLEGRGPSGPQTAEAGRAVREVTDQIKGELRQARLPDAKLSKVSETVREITDELAEEAKQIGVLTKERVVLVPANVSPDLPKLRSSKRLVQLKEGEAPPKGLTSLQRERLGQGFRVQATIKRPFQGRRDFFPHLIPEADALRKGTVRADVIENLTRQKIASSPAEAAAFTDDYIRYMDTGQKQQSLIDYMVETGQAKNGSEAFANLQRFRQRTIKRAGSLEFAREVNLPFYDPDPARVLPAYIAKTSKRLSQIKLLGQENENVNALVKGIRDAGGDADFTRAAVDRILEITNRPDSGAVKLGRALRSFNAFKLGLAQIPNATQGALNTALAADFPAVAAGFRGILTKQGRKLGLQSGATLDTVVQETLKDVGAAGKPVRVFLKATGFSATERANRTFAANAGLSYAKRQFQKLLKAPKNGRARDVLTELGVNVDEAVKRGALDGDELLMAAKKFSDLTQFRSRPQDLPLFASSETGKIFFQFKSFIYGQTRLIKKELIDEFAKKRFGRGLRSALILGGLFPATGELVANMRSAATGRERRTEGWERYFEDIAQVGAAGILMEMVQSASFPGGITKMLAGPTLSSIGDVADAGHAAATGNFTPAKQRLLLRQLPLGSVLANRLAPSEPRGESRSKLRGSSTAEKIRAQRKQRLRGSS